MAAQGTPQGTHGAYNGHARLIVASGHANGDSEADMRMRAINTLQCACFVAVAVLLAIGGLLAGNLTVALVAVVSGIACAVVKLVIMRAWLKYTAR
jgi:hypothetical protein